MKFLDVDPSAIEDLKSARRGRVSYPLLKMFLETGKYIVELDRTGMQQTLQGLLLGLKSYIKKHSLPIKVLVRKNRVYLMRLDIDQEGNPDPQWNSAGEGSFDEDGEDEEEETMVTPEEIRKRFATERHQATK